MADNENTILTEEESTRIINLSEAAEMDAGMYFVTDSSNGTRKVPITKLIDANLEDEYAAAPAKAVGDLKQDLRDIENEIKPDIRFNWVHGGIDNETGQLNNNGSLTRSRDEAYYKISDLFSITNGSTSVLWIIFYTESGGTYTFASATSVSAGSTYNFNSGESVVRFDIRGSLSEAALVSGVRNSQIVEDVLHLKSSLTMSRKYARLKNELANGDFHTAGSPMIATGCALSVSDNILTATGDGTDSLFNISEYLYITNLSLHHYYVGVWVKTNDDNCDAIALRIAGGLFESTIYKPVKNKWYYVAINQNTNNTGNTSAAYTIRAIYADATTQSGKSISIKQATMFYTNVDFGIGIDPALYKLMWITQHNAFWIGTQTVMIWEKESVNALTKQKNSFGQKRRPIVSFVDDDGYERAFAQFSPLSEKYNVPFTLAVSINSTIEDWQGLYAQSELGWEIAAHPSDGNLADKSTEAEIESVMVDTNAYLDAHGYKWSNVVYANGEPDERVRRIAKKYYDCGVCGSNPIINRGVIANFEIQRLPIGYPMGDTWNTLAHFKSLVDDAIANNGWCVFMTHAGMETGHPDSLTEIIDQLIDYIINDCNIEIMTLNDGFKVFGNALETGDFLGENARAGDDKTKGVAISQDGLLGNVIGRKSMDNLLTTLGQALGGTFTTSCDPDTGEYTYTFTQT